MGRPARSCTCRSSVLGVFVLHLPPVDHPPLRGTCRRRAHGATLHHWRWKGVLTDYLAAPASGSGTAAAGAAERPAILLCHGFGAFSGALLCERWRGGQLCGMFAALSMPMRPTPCCILAKLPFPLANHVVLSFTHPCHTHAEHYRDNVAALAAQGFDVYAPTLPGYGRSEKPVLPYGQVLGCCCTHLLWGGEAGWMGGWAGGSRH